MMNELVFWGPTESRWRGEPVPGEAEDDWGRFWQHNTPTQASQGLG